MTKPSDDQNAMATFWRNNSGHCVSGLVATLRGHDADSLGLPANDALATLCEKAFELSAPVDDYEEAAVQAGWKQYANGGWYKAGAGNTYFDCLNLCEEHDIEPYQWEIFEHWIVDQWLAEKLKAKGERIDMDFEGLCVWGRTCTGQAVSMDSVICSIYDEIHADDSR